MLFGRPTNLIIGAFTTVLGSAVVILANLVPPIIIPGAVVGAIGAAFGVLVALVANQDPTVKTGTSVTVVHPGDRPDTTARV